MKNFDQERHDNAAQSRDERKFVLGGETFYARASVRPEVMTGSDAIDDTTPASEVFKVVDETILEMIEDDDDGTGVGGHERYGVMRAKTDDPVGVGDLIDVTKWLVEVQTGRPTEQQSGSSSSPAATGTTSTVASSSEDTPEGPEA